MKILLIWSIIYFVGCLGFYIGYTMLTRKMGFSQFGNMFIGMMAFPSMLLASTIISITKGANIWHLVGISLLVQCIIGIAGYFVWKSEFDKILKGEKSFFKEDLEKSHEGK